MFTYIAHFNTKSTVCWKCVYHVQSTMYIFPSNNCLQLLSLRPTSIKNLSKLPLSYIAYENQGQTVVWKYDEQIKVVRVNRIQVNMYFFGIANIFALHIFLKGDNWINYGRVMT